MSATDLCDLAFGQARSKSVICLAHVTNLGNIEADFEQAGTDGCQDALQIIARAAKVWASKWDHAGWL